MLRTTLTEALGLQHPIIQAGMGNSNATPPELIAAVSNAGGLGTLGAGYMRAEQIESAVKEINRLTSRPFAVNLFVPEPYEIQRSQVDEMNSVLDTYRNELGIPPSPTITTYAEDFDAQIDVVLSMKVPICSFTFGIPELTTRAKLKSAGVYTMATATTVDEAILIEQAGLDAVVAQGSEAGGHRGTFAQSFDSAMIGTLALVPQVVDHVSLPVVAAGGIMDGRGLAASLMLGAAGVQMGTVFLAALECGVPDLFKNAMLEATEVDTAITNVYSGKPARGIKTAFMKQMSTYNGPIPPYPVQNALTSDIRKAASAQGKADYVSIWAGQGLRLLRAVSAATIVEEVVSQARQTIDRHL